MKTINYLLSYAITFYVPKEGSNTLEVYKVHKTRKGFDTWFDSGDEEIERTFTIHNKRYEGE